MTSCTQVIACWTCSGLRFTPPPSRSSSLHASSSYAVPAFPHCKARPRLVYRSPKYRRSPLCLFGGKGKTDDDGDTSAWKALEKALGGLRKEPPVQDILKEQMKEREFSGGGFGSPPGNGGDGSGDSEEENFASILDEVLQIVLATIGFIFVYIYMIRGEELSRLAKDYIRYLFGAKTSVRLRRAMFVWGRFYKRIKRKKVVRKGWLERAIVSTPTWWHNAHLLADMADDD